jgi:hypothetical protein
MGKTAKETYELLKVVNHNEGSIQSRGSNNTQAFLKSREFWEYNHCSSCLSMSISVEKINALNSVAQSSQR